MSARACASMQVHACMPACLHACTHARMHACTHCMHACTHAPVQTAVLLGVVDADPGKTVAHGAWPLVARRDALSEGCHCLCGLAQLLPRAPGTLLIFLSRVCVKMQGAADRSARRVAGGCAVTSALRSGERWSPPCAAQCICTLLTPDLLARPRPTLGRVSWRRAPARTGHAAHCACLPPAAASTRGGRSAANSATQEVYRRSATQESSRGRRSHSAPERPGRGRGRLEGQRREPARRAPPTIDGQLPRPALMLARVRGDFDG